MSGDAPPTTRIRRPPAFDDNGSRRHDRASGAAEPQTDHGPHPDEAEHMRRIGYGITVGRFAYFAARIAQKAATWAADSAHYGAPDESIAETSLEVFIQEIDALVSAMKVEDGRYD